MENSTNIILLVFAGSAIMFILVLAILLFVVTYTRKMREKEAEHLMVIKTKEVESLKAIFKAQENEREQLAGNLHDEVGPLLSALKLRISKYRRDFEKNKFDSEQLITEEENIDDIMQNVRSVSHNLTPQFVLKFGLVEALNNHINSLNNANYKFHSELCEINLDRHAQANLYRITLELINNLLKHDKPESMNVSIHDHDNEIVLEIEHDGEGISDEQFENYADQSKGLGLNSIKSRTLIINGKLNFILEQGKNPRIVLTVPKLENDGNN